MDCWRSIVPTFSVASVAPSALALGTFACCALALSGCGLGYGPGKLEILGTVPDFTLTDQAGAAFSSATQLHGVDWIADFIYTTCPGPCPRMSSQMHEVQTALLGDDGIPAGKIRLVSFTVDPAHDTPPVLADYAKRFGAQPGIWFFLTGPEDALHHLSRDAFMLGDVNGSLEHSTRFVLVDRRSRIRGFYLTSDPDAITRLIADTKSLARRERD
jgi:protein SCO1/2